MAKHIELNNEIMKKDNKGFYSLDKDLEAISDFKKEVDKKTKKFNSAKERFEWLIKNNYYIDFFKLYTLEDIEMVSKLVYSYKFEFKSYMAISKFYQSYSLKTDDKSQYLETYEDRIVAVSLYLAQGSLGMALKLAESMIEQRYQPATPTFLNSGRTRRGELISCFLLSCDDSLNSINQMIGTCGQLSKIGGGVSVNLSNLRARGEEIKGIKNSASGVMPVAKLLEDTFSYVNQLGQRNGAGVAYLNIFHYDIEEFLDSKKINASEKSRLQTLSIGLIVPDKFMELAEKGKDYYAFAPHSIYKETGLRFDEINIEKEYDNLVSNPNIMKKKLNPRKMLTKIAKTQFESGYPYMMYSGNANKVHALKDIGDIKMSNLCSEIFQLQETSVINDYGIDDMIKRDICCNLGSLNIVNVMELKDIKGSVYSGIDALTSVADLSSIANAPTIKKANDELKSVGLGVMNLHGYLAKNHIDYESKDAIEFVDKFFMMVNYYSIKRSMEIAKERNKTFKDFELSEYAKGTYFDEYINEDYTQFTNRNVSELFEGIYVPTQEDWRQLSKDVKKYGMYHAYRLAIAPTQSIAYIQNATPSVMPITDVIERRTYGDSTTYYPMPYLSKETSNYYLPAYYMEMQNMIDLISTMQKHIDQGISMTLFVDSNTTTRELARLYIYAYKKGLKSIYYARNKNIAFGECESCSV